MGWAFFLGYWPIVYHLGRVWKPATIGVFTLGYYFGAYKRLALPFADSNLQSSLNNAAVEFKEKYHIKMDADYLN